MILGVIILVCAVVGVAVWKYRGMSVDDQAAAVPPVAAPSPEGVQGLAVTPQTPVSVPAASANAESVLEFTPETTSVAAGQSFTLDAIVRPGKNRVSGAELHVRYDSKKVKLVAIKASPLFSLELQSSKIDNVAGTASIALATQLSEASVDAAQTIATFSFEALASGGSTSIAIADTSLVSADREVSNVLKAVKATQVMITAKE